MNAGAIAAGRAAAAGPHRLCVAPMMRKSHPHARQLWRMLCPSAMLYTEMVPAAALAHCSRVPAKFRHDPRQNPVALQIAGRDPRQIAGAAVNGAKAGYSEINLNCGCPSPKVVAGQFGVSLMSEPDTVANCVRAALDSGLPVTVKCRIGVRDAKPEVSLDRFTVTVAAAGVKALIVHAREAWLGGLNPAQNRRRPPLRHERVFELKRRMPGLPIVVNGGISTVGKVREMLARVDGVMVGRAAVERTMLLAELEEEFSGRRKPLAQILDEYFEYCRTQLAGGAHPRRLFAPLNGLASFKRGAREFRRVLAKATCATADLGELRRSASLLA